MLLAANETNITIDGVATLPINLSKFQSTADFILSPNIDEIILGRDWLHENNTIWYFSQNTIAIADHHVKLRSVSTKSSYCKRCIVKSNFNVEPLSEADLPVNIVFGYLRVKPEHSIWSTTLEETVQGLQVARTLLQLNAGAAEVRVCNTTDCPTTLSN